MVHTNPMTPTSKPSMTWSDAIDLAMEPTDLDRAFDKTNWLRQSPRLNAAGTELTDFDLVRERAAFKYIEAHEGEEAEVHYRDPYHETNLVYRTKGVLRRQYLKVPVFTDDPAVTKTMSGFVVGDVVVPLAGVSAIRVEGDRSVVVL